MESPLPPCCDAWARQATSRANKAEQELARAREENARARQEIARLRAALAECPPPSDQQPAGAGGEPSPAGCRAPPVASPSVAIAASPHGLLSMGTAVHAFRHWCQVQPDKVLYTWQDDEGNAETEWTYRDVETRANAICHALLNQWNRRPGDRAALMYLPGLDFIAAFWGCLFAGVIAVPVYPVDLRADAFGKSVGRFGGIVAACQPAVVLTHTEYLDKKRLHGLKHMFGGAGSWPEGLEFHATDELEPRADCRCEYEPGPEQIAFLQFTSGSTGDPKGVMVSHGNILHNMSIMGSNWGLHQDDVGVSWLPQYHDMGLIAYFLFQGVAGASTVAMAPMTFLRRPGLWLSTISWYKAAYFSAPNFAFQRCVDKREEILKEYPMEVLSLGQLKFAVNAAEPIRWSTLKVFEQIYLDAGFRPESWSTTYGLAENVLYVSGYAHEPVLLTVNRDALEKGLAMPAEPSEQDCVQLVGCGHTCPGSEIGIEIVDPHTCIASAPEQVGEIWVSGPSKAQGYWGRDELTRDTFQATIQGDPTSIEYLRTGDLGFIHQGELYVCSRLKDLIIICGRNIYPQDIEHSAESNSNLRPGCSAAFSVDVAGEEMLVLVAEVRGKHSESELEQIMTSVQTTISSDNQLRCHSILLLKQRTIPKTTSGKIRRNACKQGFLDWLGKQQQQAAAAGTENSDWMFGRVAGWVAALSSDDTPALLHVLASRLREDKVDALSATAVNAEYAQCDEQQATCFAIAPQHHLDSRDPNLQHVFMAMDIVQGFQADLLEWAPTRKVMPDQALNQVSQFRLFSAQLQTLVRLFHRLLKRSAGTDLPSLSPAQHLAWVHALFELSISLIRRGSNFFGSRRVNKESKYSQHAGNLERVRRLEDPMVRSRKMAADVEPEWLADGLGASGPIQSVDKCQSTSGSTVAILRVAEFVANDADMLSFLRSQALLQWNRGQWLKSLGITTSVGSPESSLVTEYCRIGTQVISDTSPGIIPTLKSYNETPSPAQWQRCLDSVRTSSSCLGLLYNRHCSLRQFFRVVYALIQQDTDFAQMVGYQNTLSRIPLMFVEQQQCLCADFAKDRVLGSYMLVEETPGSAMKSIHARIKDRQLSGTKYWGGFGCGLAKYGDGLPVDWYVVSAFDENNEWRLVLVDGRSKGVTVDRRWSTLGLRKTPFAQVTFKNVPVVFNWGTRSFEVALQTMNVTRLGIAVSTLGILDRLCSLVETRKEDQHKLTLQACRNFVHYGLGLLDAVVEPESSAADPVDMQVCIAIKVLFPDYALELAEELEMTLDTTALAGTEDEFSGESFGDLVNTLRITCIFEGPSELWYSELLKLAQPSRTRHSLSETMKLSQPRESAHYIAFNVLSHSIPEDHMAGSLTAWITSEVDRLWKDLSNIDVIRDPVISHAGERTPALQRTDSSQTQLDSLESTSTHKCGIIQRIVEQVALQEVQQITGNMALTAEDSLLSAGIDSIKAAKAVTSLSKALKRALGISAVKLSAVLFLEHSTVSELAAFIVSQVSIGNGAKAHDRGQRGGKEQLENALAPRDHLVIRVSGMGCSLAGGTQSPDMLWSTLLVGRCPPGGGRHMPPYRWRVQCVTANMPAEVQAGYFLGEKLQHGLAHEHGGFAADKAHQFDMHVQFLLDTSLRALTNGGLAPATVSSTDMGVFTASQLSGFIIPHSPFLVARAIASVLWVSGPNQNQDAACSSGYLATHHAMQALKTGQCPVGALVSGVSLLLKPDTALELHTMGILSPSGMMRPFDEAADGMVWGEAGVAIVLQSEAAEQDNAPEPTTCALTKGSTGLGMTVCPSQLVVKNFKDMPAGQPNPGLTAVPALKLGDRIVAVDGVRVQTRQQLKEQVAQSGETVQITIERDQSRTMASFCRLVGSAVSCNNARMPTGYTADRMVQQVAEAVLADVGVVPERLAICHPHAMGNPGSDGPELRGLLQALRPEERQGKLVLAGHKANFGHSVCAAGLISVVVSTLALKHRVVPVHLGVVNLLDILQKVKGQVVLPVDSPTKLEESGSEEQYASISGVGVSGHNVHMVLSQGAEREENFVALYNLVK